MRRAEFLPVVIAGVSMLFASCGEAPVETSQEEEGGEEVVVEKVENPCDCLGRNLTEGQRRYCREAKRDTRFLESLRNCGMGEVGGVSAVDNMPDDGQYAMGSDRSIVEWKGRKAGMVEKGTVPIRSCVFSVEEARITNGSIASRNAVASTKRSALCFARPRMIAASKPSGTSGRTSRSGRGSTVMCCDSQPSVVDDSKGMRPARSS